MDVPYTEIVCIGFSGSMLVMSAIVLLMLQIVLFLYRYIRTQLDLDSIKPVDFLFFYVQTLNHISFLMHL